MSIGNRLREYLDSRRVKYVVISHSPSFTAQEIAASMHVPGRELAKTVVIKHPGGLAMAVVRAQDKVDLERVAKALGGASRLATEQEFANAFPDCELGAMPPFGNVYDVPTLVDESLASDQELVFNAGTHTDAVRMAYADYAALVQPQVLNLTGRMTAARP